MKVIVTDAALRTALYVIRSLGRDGVDVTAADCDYGTWANPGSASRYAKYKAILPNPITDEDKYIEQLLKLCKGHDVLLPVSMYSIKAVSKHLDEFLKIIKVPIADYEKLIKANSTDSAIKAAISCGVPVPTTWFVTDLKQLDDFSKTIKYPVFIKVKDELELAPAQRHVAAYSREDLIKKYYALHSYQPFPLVQEFIKGDGVGFFTLFGKDSLPRAVFGHKRIREYPLDGGPSTCCESYYNEQVFEYGARLLKSIGWYGLAMVEFKIDENSGTPKFMEINPRVWGSMPLAIESGVDFPLLWLKTALGEEYAPVTEFRLGVKVRFFFHDLRAALASIFNPKKFNKYFLGFIKDLFDTKIKDGIFTFSDFKPGLVRITKTLLIVGGYFKKKNIEFRLDLHVHSKYSYDSFNEPRDIVKTALAKGLKAVAITDHGTIKGALEAKKYETAGISVIIGEEISTDRGDVVGLFLKEEIKESNFEKAVDEIKRQGGIAVLAHPYKRTGVIAESVISRVDAVEAFNSRADRNRFSTNNEKASELARGLGLPELAGSDAHFLSEIGRAYNIIPAKYASDVKEAILTRKLALRGENSSVWLEIISKLIKMFKLRQPSMLIKVPFNLLRFIFKAARPQPYVCESGKKLNILLVLDDFSFKNPGGAGTMFFEYAKNLAKKGHVVSMLFQREDGELPLRGQIEGINYYAYDNYFRNSFLFFLFCIYKTCSTYKEILRAHKIDIISCHHPLPAVGIFLPHKSRSIPVICSFYSSWEAEYLSHKVFMNAGLFLGCWFKINCLARRYIEKYSMRNCRKIIVLSDYTKGVLLDSHGIKPSKVKLIPGGIDTEIFKPALNKQIARDKIALPKDKIILFTLRRLVPRMGLENLINAMPIILKQRKDVLLIIGGIGQLDKQLKELITALKIEQHVQLTGFIASELLPLYYQSADLFVLPSTELEGFGLVTLEALSSGLPVLGTPIGGTNEILGGLGAQYLFKGTAPETIAGQVTDFITQSDNKSACAACRGYAAGKYSWDIVITQVENLFREVLASCRSANGVGAPAMLIKYLASGRALEKNIYENILVIVVAGIGDFIESINALKNIRESYPEAKISLLVSSKVYDYARQCPFANEVYSFPVSRGRGFTIDSIGRYLGLIAMLRKKKFDAALNLYEVSSWGGALRMALLLKSVGPGISFGRDTEGKGFFYSRSIKEKYSDGANQAHNSTLLAERFTNRKSAGKAVLWINNEDVKSVDALLSGWGFSRDEAIMLINPGSDRLTRRWRSDYFAEVIDYFASKHTLKPVFIGILSEAPLALEISKLCKEQTYSAMGKLTIGGLVSLVGRSKIMFTTNTAAMHIAGILGVPLVAPAGSGDILRDMPEGDQSKMVLLLTKIACNPCYNYKCHQKNYMECMKVITPSEVINEGRRLINGK